MKIQRRKTDPKNHWLDYAEEKYGVNLVMETKTIMNILKLYIPLPFYWAVYMQQYSRWVFQATKMDRNLGFYTVFPDQIVTISPILVILTLPLCNFVLYPILRKLKFESSLNKMTLGGVLGFAAITTSAFLEMKIPGNFVSIYWLIPQYFFIALSENFLFASQMSFVYKEAPANMKSVMTASVFFIIAFGNLFVVLISGVKAFESQVNEFFFYAGILFIATIVFGILASKYESNRLKVDADVGETRNLIKDNKTVDKL